jgi:radical SAM superfamily enzyme YgiQ (UPF0313 family)
MKIIYIFPPLGHGGLKVRSFPLAPPVLEYLAGLTSRIRPDWEVRLINANAEYFQVEDLEADLVGITVLTHQSSWAYRTADILRKRGIKVVLGGPHPSVLPDEAGQHADSIISGEAEGVLEEVFHDFERNDLKQVYSCDFLPMEDLPFPRRDLLKGYIFHSFSTSRGCPYNCKFCATPRLHGREMRYRPIDEVIEDISGFRHKMWFSTDADIWGPDVPRYIELFKRMSYELPSIYWAGEGSIASVQHRRGEEMLRWARKSGLMQVWIGWESMDHETLKEYGATSKLDSHREDALKKIRDSGIDMVLFLMLGMRGEQMDEYKRVLEVSDRLSVTLHPVMVVPYPGTLLYEELKSERIYDRNWDFYDGMHSMIREDGEKTENQERDKALSKLWVDLFTYPRIFKRISKLSMRGFPSAHIASWMVQSALRRAFREYIEVGKRPS